MFSCLRLEGVRTAAARGVKVHPRMLTTRHWGGRIQGSKRLIHGEDEANLHHQQVGKEGKCIHSKARYLYLDKSS